MSTMLVDYSSQQYAIQANNLRRPSAEEPTLLSRPDERSPLVAAASQERRPHTPTHSGWTGSGAACKLYRYTWTCRRANHRGRAWLVAHHHGEGDDAWTAGERAAGRQAAQGLPPHLHPPLEREAVCLARGGRRLLAAAPAPATASRVVPAALSLVGLLDLQSPLAAAELRPGIGLRAQGAHSRAGRLESEHILRKRETGRHGPRPPLTGHSAGHGPFRREKTRCSAQARPAGRRRSAVGPLLERPEACPPAAAPALPGRRGRPLRTPRKTGAGSGPAGGPRPSSAWRRAISSVPCLSQGSPN